ncbi:MAG: 4-hydroxy-tetrahydrodipicolinate reductase [Gammaproteobacteria bacterium]
MTLVRIGVSGAAGRMGRRITAAVLRHKKTALASALEFSGHAELGQDAAVLAGEAAAGVCVADKFNPAAEVFIDFSAPSAALSLAAKCREHRIPLVVGTTGFNDAEERELKNAGADIALVFAPNMSAGVHVMFELAALAARRLRGYDMEIAEAHHREKRDAPSGTALRLGEVMAEAAGVNFSEAAVFSRRGQGKRKSGDIGFSALRGGDIVGEHRAVFAGDGEYLEIIHRSGSRDNYASGAVLAAIFAARAAPGLYDMRAVLESSPPAAD